MDSPRKTAKQSTLDNLPKAQNKQATKTSKQITITQVKATTKEDELALQIGFKLQPSRTMFSKVRADLWFDNFQISSVLIRVLQGPLATDELEFSPILDMRGIAAGAHIVKVEMYEKWDSGERLWQTSNELMIDYMPLTRDSRLIKVPSVKSVAGADLAVVSDSERNIYKEIEKTVKTEQFSKRDDY